MAGKNIRKQNIIQLALLVAILLTINILGSYLFTRIDMTAEKRYTLSESSKQITESLSDIIYIKIYLDGELPPGFRRLQNATREMLDEFRIYAGDKIEYEFIDPSQVTDDKSRMDLYKQLATKGLLPTNLEQSDKGGQSQKIIFPGAILSYRSREMPLQLLKNRIGNSPEEMLNISIENLEYEFCSAFRKITLEKGTKIGFLIGQNEIISNRIGDAIKSLREFYTVDTVGIYGQLHALDGFAALLIVGPESTFEEKDKFVLDQYIMSGGKVFWLINNVQMDMDSLTETTTSLALSMDLNLADMLFRYGARINGDLVMDLQAAPISVVTGTIGNQPQQKLFPWYYFPLLQTESPHPIVHNLNAVKGEFVSSVDTIESDGVQKTILLTSSKFGRIQMSPARVSLNILRDDPDPKLFSKRFIPVAVLLEGSFTSNFLNRIPEHLANSPELNFKTRSVETSMIVAGDANLITNYISQKGVPYPMGYDRYTGQSYGNRSFLMNCVDYLCGNKNILSLRSKEFKLRLLDPAKTENKSAIQWINMLLPVFIVGLFAFIFNLRKKQKYARGL